MPKTKTISELQKELKAKQAQVERLQSRRNALEAQLAATDLQIAALIGASGPAKAKKKKAPKKKAAKKTKRGKNKQGLADVLAQVLEGKEGVKIPDAMALVLAAGYKTKSKQFQHIVNKTLLKDKRFKKVARGKYALKGKKKAAAKKKATKKKAAPGEAVKKG